MALQVARESVNPLVVGCFNVKPNCCGAVEHRVCQRQHVFGML